MNTPNFLEGESESRAAFNQVLEKLRDLGWVERTAVGLGGEFKDVRLTGSGSSGLMNVNALETALGGLTGLQAEMLFLIARKLANDKPETN